MNQTQLILIIILIITLGCNDANDIPIVKDISFEEIAKSALYGNGEEGISQSNMVIQNENDWKSLMTKMDSYNNATENFNKKNVDFDSYTIIAVFLEIKMYGHEVGINKVTEKENHLYISTIEKQSMATVICQPYSIIEIPKTELPIIFE
ncbi:hypothetical protein [Carboxylicivirga sp. N1Y90]|uniref:hypothetical protein n=1 Tax=Carboxylicivirga fragile TaxID=3417571 RepID=UPI003D34D7BA|nr:protease complex subunit PrcB family protein [Marinilabiliaceae bacterium N1Y90]